MIQESAFGKADAQNFDQAQPAQKLLPIINRGRFLRIKRVGCQRSQNRFLNHVRYIFLLEIIIGIGLSACLLSILFRFLVSYATIEKKIEAAQIVLLEQERIQEKLGELFTSIEPVEEMEASFYTLQFPDETSTSLILSFNAGVDPDPAFSGLNIGRLYLNKKGEFCLTQWTRDKNNYRTEVLLKNITAFDWELLGKKPEKETKAIPIAGPWAWLLGWPKKQNSIPSMIRLKLWCNTTKRKQSEPNLQFAFILPTQEPIQIFK